MARPWMEPRPPKRHRAERERLRRKRKFNQHMNNRIRMLASPQFLPPHSKQYPKFQRFKVFADEGAEPSLKQEAKETRQAIVRFCPFLKKVTISFADCSSQGSFPVHFCCDFSYFQYRANSSTS